MTTSRTGSPQAGADERLDRELADTFPASDTPSAISPSGGEEPRLGPRPEAEPPSKSNDAKSDAAKSDATRNDTAADAGEDRDGA